jgi:N6-adenosine-specific RNA methylase IME4
MGIIPVTSVVTQVLDARPIKLDGFTLRARSAVAVGRPTLDQWTAALTFALAAGDAAPYWIGDLLNYADNREDWQERLDQAKAITGHAHETLMNHAWLARHVDDEVRNLAPTPSHAKLVAPMAKADQIRLMDKARTEGLKVREMKQIIKAEQRPAVIDGRAVLRGKFRIILADPPWQYRQNNPTKDGSLRKADQHYPTMTIEQLCKLPVQAHALDDAILFLWVTAPLLWQNPGPREVMEAWGFKYKSNRVWNKVLGNPGNYGMQVIHEHLMIGVRGRCLPDEPVPHDPSVETIRRSDNHSEKPEEFRQYITRHWTQGPYLELFARKKTKGWSSFGNDARLWKGSE